MKAIWEFIVIFLKFFYLFGCAGALVAARGIFKLQQANS